MLGEEELNAVGEDCVNLHKFYLDAYKSGESGITLHFKDQHFLKGEGYILVSFSDLFDLFNLDALDVSLLQCWTL